MTPICMDHNDAFAKLFSSQTQFINHQSSLPFLINGQEPEHGESEMKSKQIINTNTDNYFFPFTSSLIIIIITLNTYM